MLHSAAHSIGRQTLPRLGSHEPCEGYESVGFTPRIGRLAPIVRLARNRTERRAMRGTLAAARTARMAVIAAQRLAEPGDAFLPAQDVGFLRRHPRYWSDEERDTFHALRTERSLIAATMQYAGSNDGRSQQAIRAASSVNAASTSHASKRSRVSDAFDARSAKERSKARPYSKRQLALDIERNYPTPRIVIGKDGTPIDQACYSIKPDGTREVFYAPATDQAEERSKPAKPRQLSRKERLAARNAKLRPANA